MQIPDPTQPTPRDQSEPWMLAEEWRRRHERNVELARRSAARMIIYGASIVEAWNQDPSLKELFDGRAIGLGVSGDTTQHLLWRLLNGETDAPEPETVVLSIGNNNLGLPSQAPAAVAQGILAADEALAQAFPRARRVVLAIPPNSPLPSDPIRRRAREVDFHVAARARARRFHFGDIGGALLDRQGRVDPALAADGVHPTAEGYRRLAWALQRVVKQAA